MATSPKIKLISIRSELFIFDDKDWSILRKEHRIIGNFVGCFNSLPVLPLKLMPEEVHLLLDKQIGEIVKYKKIDLNPGHFDSALLKEERLVYKKNRKRELEGKLDKIVASKRKKGDTRGETEILNDELNRSSVISNDKMIWPITTIPLCFDTEAVDYTPEIGDYLRCTVYKDLWEKGYFITAGEKFGGDFLAYQGDPITHHAMFIIRCVRETESMLPGEIIAFGRLATSVKKRAILASLLNNEVSYITINWIDD